MAKRAVKKKTGGGWWRRLLLTLIGLAVLGYGSLILALVGLKYANPWTTGVQAQRRIEALLAAKKYEKKQNVVPLTAIPLHVQHAVLASEDAHFYQHYGFDVGQVEDVLDDLQKGKKAPRGASTITQQLVKNLFFTTSRSLIRKGIETLLVWPAEIILGKKRILELYLNNVEWGPGVYGIDSGARYHYGVPVSRLTRDQAVRLAAILPAPRR